MGVDNLVPLLFTARMSWETIHCYAKEAELWTSLAVNIYVILSAVIFGCVRAIKSKLSLRQQIDIALSWAYVLGAFVFAIGFLNISIHPPTVDSRYITVPMTALWFILGFVGLAANLHQGTIRE